VGGRFVVSDLWRHVTGLLSELIMRKIRERLAPGSVAEVEQAFERPSYARLEESPIYLGRFISDRVYLRYEHSFSGRFGRAASSASEASGLFRLGNGFELDTTFGDEGVGDVNFIWTTKH
jgi:hypothetical protein